MEKIFEQSKEIPVLYTADTLVVGGGIAGISAALSAARLGKKVILCERNYILGGLATAGLVAIYLPICDGLGSQVSFGIAEELLRLSISIEHNDKRGIKNWILSEDKAKRTENDPRFEVDFNPQLYAILLERLLLSENVKILYGCYVTGCVKKGNRIDAVFVESKSGRIAVKAKTYVDASGDCDLALFSNTPTVLFKQGNVIASWYYYLKNGNYELNSLGFSDIPDEAKKKGEAEPELLSDKRFTGVTAEELTEMTEISHKCMLNDILKRRTYDEKLVPCTIPTTPQIRMSRRISGEYTLSADEINTEFKNSIGLVSDWKKRGYVYEVPFDILYNKSTVNLICAGRCVSNTEDMWDILRSIPCCAVTGQAAGTACGITDDFTKTDIKLMQDILFKNKVVLHKKDL